MRIRILGAHNLESRDTRCISLLIDDRLAIDAGSLTSSLSFDEQTRLDALIITHKHMDHVRDLPGIGLALRTRLKSLPVYMTKQTEEAVKEHLLNGVLYPRLYEASGATTPLELRTMTIGATFEAGGFTVQPLPATHVGGTAGLLISDGGGGSLYFTSDTGPFHDQTRADIKNVQAIVTDITMSNVHEAMAIEAGHMTPGLLEHEMVLLQKSGTGPLPRVVAVHLDSVEEPIIREELADAARRMDMQIDVGYAGMEFEL
ncbi:MAG: MBL fold metallo-hydrolase [Chloroflexota bacterium]